MRFSLKIPCFDASKAVNLVAFLGAPNKIKGTIPL